MTEEATTLTSAEKSLNQLQQQYNNLCLGTGEVRYKIHIMQKELKQMCLQMETINKKAHTIRQNMKKDEAAKVEEKFEAKTEATEAIEVTPEVANG